MYATAVWAITGILLSTSLMTLTSGMKPIFNSKRIEIYCDGGDLNWQLASLRLALMHPPTLDRPGTLLQLHPNPKESVLFIADKLTARPVIVAPK